MKVVHVNFDTGPGGGATIGAERIHLALLEEKIDSIFITPHPLGVLPKRLEYPLLKIHKFYIKIMRKFLNIVLKSCTGKAHPLNIIPTGMHRFINAQKPDIVHLHWIKADTISLKEICKINAPVVWHLHDLWPFLGFDAYPHDENYKNQYKNADFFERWLWMRKQKVINKKNIHFITSGKFWRDFVTNNFLTITCGRIQHIVYPFDKSNNQHIPDVNYKQTFEIPKNKFILLFGAHGGTKNKIKGFERVVQAFRFLDGDIKKDMCLIVFGEEAQEQCIEGIPTCFTGFVKNHQVMSNLYSSADLFLFPSYQETFGQTKSEAMICGTPVIAFDQTACSEGIIHQKTGWIAPPNDYKNYADGICWWYGQWKQNRAYPHELRNHIMANAACMCDFHDIATKIIDFYNKIIKK